MKTLAIILLVFSLNICLAQNQPVLPNAYNTERANTLQSYIGNYQSQTNPPIPLSFIIRTNDILSYYHQLEKLQPNTELYFHVYFGIDPNDPQVVRLIIVPSIQISDNKYILAHDPAFTSVFVPPLFELLNSGNPLPNQFCYNPDQFDATKLPLQCPCFFKTSSLYATFADLSSPDITTATAKTWIKKYQDIYNNNVNTAATYIQSFTFDATELMDFIDSNNVPLLQIYIGQDYSLQENIDLENYTLVFVGLDLLGNHIPVAGSLGSALAFEACWPCPKCGVAIDNNIDDQPQLIHDYLPIEGNKSIIHEPEQFNHKSHIRKKITRIKSKQRKYTKKINKLNRRRR